MRDVDRRALGPLQQVGHIAGAHVVGGLAVDGDDQSPGMNAGAISGRARERSNDDHFVVARPDGHADAVVLAALVFAQQRVGLGIEEIGVRIEHVQHARDRAVVDGLVGIHRLGVVLLDEGVDVGELLEAVADVGVAGERRLLAGALGKQNAQKSAGKEEKSYQEE